MLFRSHHFTPEQIMAAAGLKPGQQVSKEIFDAARARLMETGAGPRQENDSSRAPAHLRMSATPIRGG